MVDIQRADSHGMIHQKGAPKCITLPVRLGYPLEIRCQEMVHISNAEVVAFARSVYRLATMDTELWSEEMKDVDLLEYALSRN